MNHSVISEVSSVFSPVAGGRGALGMPGEQEFPEAPQEDEVSWKALFLWN